jgi:hypothetical protein
VSALAGLRDDARYLQMTAPVQPGSSGGPLLDSGGNLVGVITSKLDALAMAKRTGDIPQNVNFAVKTEVLEAFLRTNKVAYDVAVTDRQLSVADVGDIAKDATVKIICEPSGVQTAETETVRAAPSDEPMPVPAPPGEAAVRPIPVPVPVPQMEPRGPIPVPADGGQRAMTEQIQVIDVRTPYPGTAPAMREIDIRNDAPYSVLQVTIGWLQSLTGPQCPRSPSAYLGTKELFASLKSGESTTLTGEFTEQARYFCIISLRPLLRVPCRCLFRNLLRMPLVYRSQYLKAALHLSRCQAPLLRRSRHSSSRPASIATEEAYSCAAMRFSRLPR